MNELKFVDVGEGITEGNIKKWLVEDGSYVKEDQPIAQVETDKAVVSLPAPISGKIKIIAKEGTVKVGDTLAYVGTNEELSLKQSSTVLQKKQESTSNGSSIKTTQLQDEVKISVPNIQQEARATPSVRRLAHELNINVNEIKGTGPNNRILENDIRAAASLMHQQKTPSPIYSELKEEAHKEEVERMPLSQVRKAIARNMELSWTIPRAVHMDMIDASALYAVIEKEKPKLAKKEIKLTVLPFIVKAVVNALIQNERFNSSYDKEKQEIILKRYYNIGIAAEADDGLRVAVIKQADKLSIIQLAKLIQQLGAKVKDKTISIEEMSDTTFTITNIGSLGGGFLSVPMINYPDVAILGVHLIKDTPIVKNGVIVIGKQLPFSLTFDHRVVDGAEAVRFGNTIKEYLEDPDFLELS